MSKNKIHHGMLDKIGVLSSYGISSSRVGITRLFCVVNFPPVKRRTVLCANQIVLITMATSSSSFQSHNCKTHTHNSFCPFVLIDKMRRTEENPSVFADDLKLLIQVFFVRGNSIEKMTKNSASSKLTVIGNKYGIVNRVNRVDSITLSRIASSFPERAVSILSKTDDNNLRKRPVSLVFMRGIVKDFPKILMFSNVANLIPKKDSEYWKEKEELAFQKIMGAITLYSGYEDMELNKYKHNADEKPERKDQHSKLNKYKHNVDVKPEEKVKHFNMAKKKVLSINNSDLINEESRVQWMNNKLCQMHIFNSSVLKPVSIVAKVLAKELNQEVKDLF